MTGLPLGLPLILQEQDPFQFAVLELGSGDVLVFASDGVEEAQDGRDGFYEGERLRAVIQSSVCQYTSAEEIRDEIFSPFFTTKPVGKGTGLGLNISYKIIEKHSGEVKVFSKPGKTRFQVSLPVDFNKIDSGNSAQVNSYSSDDVKLRRILETTKSVAVVGISDKEDQANHSVPRYLQTQGYKIFPVNPRLEEVLGEKSYPDLISIPEEVDVVEIFRRSEAVPEIVDQAIQIGAKVVWMQEGIVNEAAADAALEAGLEVVMDTCMRATHKRIWAK